MLTLPAMTSTGDAGGGARRARWWWPVGGAAACLVLGWVSGLVGTGDGGWYRDLEKPPGTPPAWIFGPVWTVLYLLMGWAAGRLLAIGARRPFALFAFQFLLNLAWTPVFFGLRQPSAALGILALLWVALAWTIRASARRDRPAAFLLAPYLAWISYAAYLNAGIVLLNR